MGIRDRPTSPYSPWQDGFAEGLIGSIRRECSDHAIVMGEPALFITISEGIGHLGKMRRSLGPFS
jgi:hypothetical protein